MKSMSNVGLLARTLICSSAVVATAAANANPAAGVAQVSTPSVTCPSQSSPFVQSISVIPEFTGNLIVTASGRVNIGHALGSDTEWCVVLTQTSGDVSACGSAIYLNQSVNVAMNDINYLAPTSFYGQYDPYSIGAVYPVRANKTYKFYVNGYAFGVDGVCTIIQPSLTALFVPLTLRQASP